MDTTLSRRAIFAAPAVALLLTAGRGHTESRAKALRWRELESGFAVWSGPVVLAIKQARAAGMDPDELAAVNFPNRGSAFVVFYVEAEDRMRSFNAAGEQGWHS